MAKQAIETRIEKLENGAGEGSGRVALVFEDDDSPMPEAGTIIQVRFVESAPVDQENQP